MERAHFTTPPPSKMREHWSITVVATIVSKVTKQSPCHKHGGSLYSVTECGVVAFVYEHKPVTDRASVCISFH